MGTSDYAKNSLKASTWFDGARQGINVMASRLAGLLDAAAVEKISEEAREIARAHYADLLARVPHPSGDLAASFGPPDRGEPLFDDDEPEGLS